MKIAIHHNEGSFSKHWIIYCEEHKISYKIVNCYDNDINDQLRDYDVLLWHHQHKDYRDLLFAKQLLFALEQSGKKVFPNFNTNWHFDDKVGQKYLLEAINAPLVPSYVFYSKEKAMKWLNTTSFPKVFKLRGGAGSSNVKLINNKKEAERLINISFSRGFPQYHKWDGFVDRVNKYRTGKATFKNVLGGIHKLFFSSLFDKMTQNEKGYFYVQDFIPQNDSDIRVIVIGDKAFAIKRMVRANDFRASGSGEILYDKENFSKETISLSFEIAKKLNTQCIAFDFIFDKNNNPLIVEISFGFSPEVYFKCEGFWDSNLQFHNEKLNPFAWILEDLIQ